MPDDDAGTDSDPLAHAEPEDLQRFGLIPELVGRLPVMVTLEELDEEALTRILKEPKNALVKQYAKMFELEGVGLTFDPDAIRAIASRGDRPGHGGTGALAPCSRASCGRSCSTLPSRNDVREVVVTPEAVKEGIPPLLLLHSEARKKEA